MINSIIKAISIALNEEFCDRYEIYMEEIKQGLKEPCFFISCLNPTNRLFMGKKYFRQNQFCIQYFPETEEKRHECNMVAEQMQWCLEYITADGKLMHGANMKYEMADEVLNFFVNYDCFVYKAEEKDESMESMSVNVHAKEGD